MEQLLEIFEDELAQISNPDIQAFARYALINAPGYFWVIPASSSGKFHAKQSLGEGGLLRHTKMAARVLLKLVRPCLEADIISQDDADLALVAILLHDTYKRGEHGKQAYCKPHGAIAAAKTYQLGRQWLTDTKSANFTEQQMREMCGMICWHMGPWSTPTSKGYLKPYEEFTRLENIVHQADITTTERTFKMTDIADPEGVGIG